MAADAFADGGGMSKLWEAIKDLERERDRALNGAPEADSTALVAYLDEIRHRQRDPIDTTKNRGTVLSES
jgi:hypothetical protein